MLPGRYNYTIKKKIGSKQGYIDVEIEKNALKGVMFIKNREVPITGKVDGHKVELYGSIVGKIKTYVFSVGAYFDGNTFKGKLEDKRGAKEIMAVFAGESAPVAPVAETEGKAE